MGPVWHCGQSLGTRELVDLPFIGLCTVYHRLFTLPLGVICRLCSVTVVLAGYLLYHCAFNPLSRVDQDRLFCKQCVDPDETAHNEPSHQDLHCLPFCSSFTTVTRLAAMHVSKRKDGIVHFRNLGMKGLNAERWVGPQPWTLYRWLEHDITIQWTSSPCFY